MSAPSKAGACKPDNPARAKVSHQTGTELCAQGGNNLREAMGRMIVGHNASEGIEPRNFVSLGQGFHILEASSDAAVRARL